MRRLVGSPGRWAFQAAGVSPWTRGLGGQNADAIGIHPVHDGVDSCGLGSGRLAQLALPRYPSSPRTYRMTRMTVTTDLRDVEGDTDVMMRFQNALTFRRIF